MRSCRACVCFHRAVCSTSRILARICVCMGTRLYVHEYATLLAICCVVRLCLSVSCSQRNLSYEYLCHVRTGCSLVNADDSSVTVTGETRLVSAARSVYPCVEHSSAAGRDICVRALILRLKTLACVCVCV